MHFCHEKQTGDFDMQIWLQASAECLYNLEASDKL
jgi:hypothetical protein